MRYLLPANNTLVVKGPSSVRVVNGEIDVLGVSLKPARKFIIRSGKQMPIEAIKSDAELEIVVGDSGEVMEIIGSAIPHSWEFTPENVTETVNATILVIGPTDVGKSTLCSFLINKMLSRSLAVRIIDADIGQGEIGPPTTIAVAASNHPILSLAELQPQSMIFLGDTSPSQVEEKLIRGVKRLMTPDKSKFTIINTDGWIIGQEATLFKTKLIRSIKPDVVLAVGPIGEIQTSLDDEIRYMQVDVPTYVLTRSRAERLELRSMGYRRFLEGAVTRTISLVKTDLRFPTYSKIDLKTEAVNSIVGLLDDAEFLLEIGILLRFDEKSIRVYTRHPGEPNQVEVGRVRLSMNGSELSQVDS